ncbi:MAG: hypothetical protein ACK5LR_02755 [Mangrovibacterium sp.]
MKKSFILAVMAAVFTMPFLGSCSKDAETDGPNQEVGEVKVSFAFEQTAQTKASASTMKPTTSWSNNIKDLMLLFTDASGVVTEARQLAPPATNDMAQHSETVTGVKAGAYKMYLIANYNESNIARAAGTGVGTDNEWTEAVKGKNISALTLELVNHTGFALVGTENTNTEAYQSPAEIFMATAEATIVADASANAAFSLTRIVSLFRVRIDQSHNGNDEVDFSTGDIRIRNINTEYNPSTYEAGLAKTNLIFADGGFSSVEPTSADGYFDAGTNGMLSGDYTLWGDYIIFPGGSAVVGGESEKKFNVVISGIAPTGYVAGDAGAITDPTGVRVYWSGQVTAEVAENSIIEVNLTLKTAGTVDIDEVSDYGNLDIEVDLIGWGNITSVSQDL